VVFNSCAGHFLTFFFKMGRYCAVIGCTSRLHDYLNRKLDNGLRFFSLPAVKEK
jgi:hypothetical protein